MIFFFINYKYKTTFIHNKFNINNNKQFISLKKNKLYNYIKYYTKHFSIK